MCLPAGDATRRGHSCEEDKSGQSADRRASTSKVFTHPPGLHMCLTCQGVVSQGKACRSSSYGSSSSGSPPDIVCIEPRALLLLLRGHVRRQDLHVHQIDELGLHPHEMPQRALHPAPPIVEVPAIKCKCPFTSAACHTALHLACHTLCTLETTLRCSQFHITPMGLCMRIDITDLAVPAGFMQILLPGSVPQQDREHWAPPSKGARRECEQALRTLRCAFRGYREQREPCIRRTPACSV